MGAVTTLDWIIVAFAALFAILGLQRGFVLGLFSLAGFALGAVLGTRLGPLVLPDGARSPYAPIFGLGGALLLGAILTALAESIAEPLSRAARRIPGFGTLDGALGALLSALVALGIAWIAGAVAAQVPGQPEVRQEVRRSRVLRALNEALPPSGPILNALSRFDPLPAIDGPRADVAPPRAAIARDPQVRGAAGSVVKITGTACGLGVEGSGWVAGDGAVVTNAHVVAGQDDTQVQVAGTGPRLPARAVAFDVRNDLALLRVEGLAAPALRLVGSPRSGTGGAILGFPLNGPYDVRAARIGATRTTLSDDAYGQGPVTRRLTSLRGNVRSGNSGGPVVDGSGRVLTTVFAATVGTRRRGGFGVPNAVVARALRSAGAEVSTGPCAR